MTNGDAGLLTGKLVWGARGLNYRLAISNGAKRGLDVTAGLRLPAAPGIFNVTDRTRLGARGLPHPVAGSARF